MQDPDGTNRIIADSGRPPPPQMNHRRLPPPSRYTVTSPIQPPRFGYNHPQSMNSVLPPQNNSRYIGPQSTNSFPSSQYTSRYIGPQSPSDALQSPLVQSGRPFLDSLAPRHEHSSYNPQTLNAPNSYQGSHGYGHQPSNNFGWTPTYNHSQPSNDFAPYPPAPSGSLYSESFRTQPAVPHSDFQPPSGFSRQPLSHGPQPPNSFDSYRPPIYNNPQPWNDLIPRLPSRPEPLAADTSVTQPIAARSAVQPPHSSSSYPIISHETPRPSSNTQPPSFSHPQPAESFARHVSASQSQRPDAASAHPLPHTPAQSPHDIQYPSEPSPVFGHSNDGHKGIELQTGNDSKHHGDAQDGTATAPEKKKRGRPPKDRTQESFPIGSRRGKDAVGPADGSVTAPAKKKRDRRKKEETQDSSPIRSQRDADGLRESEISGHVEDNDRPVDGPAAVPVKKPKGRPKKIRTQDSTPRHSKRRRGGLRESGRPGYAESTDGPTDELTDGPAVAPVKKTRGRTKRARAQKSSRIPKITPPVRTPLRVTHEQLLQDANDFRTRREIDLIAIEEAVQVAHEKQRAYSATINWDYDHIASGGLRNKILEDDDKPGQETSSALRKVRGGISAVTGHS